MSEEATTQASPPPTTAEALAAAPEGELAVKSTEDENRDKIVNDAPEPAKEVATEVSAPIETSEQNYTNGKQASTDVTEGKQPTEESESAEMEIKEGSPAPQASESATATVKPRRKSTGVPEHKKKLNKKASKAKMAKVFHPDAKPGDYFFARLKGFPPWPAIVCDESMLPGALLKKRPAAAARPDGTWRDGDSKVEERVFPVMFLQTNEFGWINNWDLLDFDPEAPAPSRPKDLHGAYQLASEQHDLQYFKDILKSFDEAREAQRQQQEAIKEAKAEKEAEKEKKKLKETKPKKSAEKKSKVVVKDEDDEDVEMQDAATEPESDDADASLKSSKSKKRKAEEPAEPPARTDSVKKPKIKLNNTAKTTNGTSTPKVAKDSVIKTPKSKSSKKASTKATTVPEAVVPKEPEMTAEEKRVKKEKEILFLRHKLQKGLLTRDQAPKAEEMRQMAEFVTKLESYTDLEVSIIRNTKINKVLKAILKLDNIPRENDFHFKPRSQTLLDKWNTLLTGEQGTPTTLATTNGVSSEGKTDEGKAETEVGKVSPGENANGSKESPEESKGEEKASSEESPAAESKEQAVDEQSEHEPAEEAVKEPAAEASAVESTS